MTFDDSDLHSVALGMRTIALAGVFDGRDSPSACAYIASCTKVAFGTALVFTRDTGHHTSGWFKNSDYERCWHLSTSPAPRVIWTPDTPDLDRDLRDRWLRAFFGEDLRHVWGESPKTPHGRRIGVWHWRLFCDARWKPIVPRGEVYDFTELGWKSSSELGIEIISPLRPG